jgi:hypothetical protein
MLPEKHYNYSCNYFMNPSGKGPGINLTKLRGKTGAAPRPTTSGPTAAELARAVMERDAAQLELSNVRITLADVESKLRRAEAELHRLKDSPSGTHTSPEDIKKLEDVASAMNAAVDGIIKLIEETKVADGSPAAEAIDKKILPALEELDKLLPQTN